MKLTYQFMNDLLALLRSNNWQKDLNDRILEINSILSSLDNTTSEAIEKKKERWEELSNQGRNVPPEDKQKEIIENLQKSSEEKRSKLVEEANDIQTSLNEGTYKLGLGVFKDINNASLLLSSINLLYSKDLDFNNDSVKAVESMLRSNFHELSIYNSPVQYFPSVSILKDFLLGKINSNTNLREMSPEYAQEEDDEEIAAALNLFLSIEYTLVKHSYEQLKPFIIYFTTYNYHDTCDDLVFSLASYFSSTQDIDNYLSTIDYSSIETIENAIDIGDISTTYNLSEKELDIWKIMNSKFHMKSMKLFTQAYDIKNNGFDIVENYTNSNENFDLLFNDIKEAINQLRFVREDENIELAKLTRLYNLDEKTFDRILNNIIPKQKSSDNLPDITLKTHDNKYTFKKLEAGDIRSLFLGKMTACCQFISGDSEQCVIDGFSKESAGFYILQDRTGKIKAQSYSWIGVNNEGEQVLILDSFEYLEETKKYFLEIAKNLSEEIKNHGYTELYIGTGGQTPDLNTEEIYEIDALDKELFRYNDSKRLYKITQDIDLAEANNSGSITYYNNFDELIKDNKILAFEALKSKDPEGILERLENSESLKIMLPLSPLLNNLLSNEEITIEHIKNFAQINHQNPDNAFRYIPTNGSTQESWKNALTLLKWDEHTYSKLINDYYKLSSIPKSMIAEIKENSISVEEALSIYQQYKDIDSLSSKILNIFSNARTDDSSNFYNMQDDVREAIVTNKISKPMQETFAIDKVTSLINSYLTGVFDDYAKDLAFEEIKTQDPAGVLSNLHHQESIEIMSSIAPVLNNSLSNGEITIEHIKNFAIIEHQNINRAFIHLSQDSMEYHKNIWEKALTLIKWDKHTYSKLMTDYYKLSSIPKSMIAEIKENSISVEEALSMSQNAIDSYLMGEITIHENE